MCGIAGSTHADPPTLDRMVSRLGHRGPDGSGTWLDPNGGAGLGHTRLAIIDLSHAGAQPMVSPCGRWVLVFNGEIYNFHLLRADLEAKGEIFVSHSDTEVLLRLLMRSGLDGLHQLVGMFAFALWDRAEKRLTLARDRLGVKPLLWGALPHGGLAFASEIDALRCQPGLDLSLDRQALSDYLACLYVPHPRSIHAGIRKLPPGHWLTWKDGVVETGQWWAPHYVGGRSPSLDEAVEELMPLLRQAVQARLVADVEVGCFLSGGIDSAIISALMADLRREQGGPVPLTLTMSFDEAAYDEREAAKAVAAHIGSRHQEIRARPEVAGYLDEMVCRFGEPFGNPTALLINDLSHKAREHVKVALVGDGGDEVFGGYPRYQGGLLAARLERFLPRSARTPLALAASLIPESSSGRHWLRRGREFLSAAAMPAAARYASWVEYFSPAERQELLGVSQPCESPIAAIYASAPSQDPLDAMQQTDLTSFLPGNLLSYGDAMSMANGLELRVPLLDHRLIEATGTLAAGLRFSEGPKTLLKACARRLLPSELIDRPKRGFNPPMGVWLRHGLKAAVKERLSPERVAACGLEWVPVQRLLAEHENGWRDHSLKVWSLLVLESWVRGQEV